MSASIITYEKGATLMTSEKYIDVHQATISVAVRDFKGKLVMESILGDEGLDHSRVLCGARRHFVGHL